MSLRTLRRFTGFILAAILFLFACQLPGKIIQSLRSPGTSIVPTPSQAGAASSTPVIVITATPVLAIPSSEPAYPAGETPGVVIPSQPAQASPPISSPVGPTVPSGTGVTGSSTGTPTSSVQGGAPGAYPSLEAGQPTLPVDNSYPGSAQGTASGSEGSYPMPGSPAASATLRQPSFSPTSTQQAGLGAPQKSASPTLTVSAQIPAATSTQVFALTATPSLTPIFVLPTALPTSGGSILFPTLLASPTASVLAPTVTPTPTRTPFLTPTPTITFTPTPTRTPLPVPPWVSVQLHATDPRTVQLAAGKPQLIEFFAFWSGPSLAMAPVVHGIEKEYTGRVGFVFLDIDDPATDIFKQQLHYRVEPHFFLLDAHGKVLQQWVGYVTVEQFRQALDSAVP